MKLTGRCSASLNWTVYLSGAVISRTALNRMLRAMLTPDRRSGASPFTTRRKPNFDSLRRLFARADDPSAAAVQEAFELVSSAAAWRMAPIGVRREKAALSSGCKAHPAISLQPEAIGAVMEVTKWLKPSNSGHDLVTR